MQLTNKLKEAINVKIGEFSNEKLTSLERDKNSFDYLDTERKMIQEYKNFLRPVITAWVDQNFNSACPNIAYEYYRDYRTDSNKLITYAKEELINVLVDGLRVKPNIASIPAYTAHKEYLEYQNLITKTKSDIFLKIPFIKTQEDFEELMRKAEETLKNG